MVTIDFSITGQALRYEVIDAEPWFHLSDVCIILGFANSRDVAAQLEDVNKQKFDRDYQTGMSPWFIDEEALYTIALGCRDARKPGTIAYQFRKFVVDVIKTIRKTGSFGNTPEQQQETKEAFDNLGILRKMESTQDLLITELNNAIVNKSTHEEKNALAACLEAVRKAKNDFQDKQKADKKAIVTVQPNNETIDPQLQKIQELIKDEDQLFPDLRDRILADLGLPVDMKSKSYFGRSLKKLGWQPSTSRIGTHVYSTWKRK